MPKSTRRLKSAQVTPTSPVTIFTTVFVFVALVLTYTAANSVQNIVSMAETSRPVLGSWSFAGHSGGSYGWAYICVDRRFESDRAVIFVPNSKCPADKSLDYNFIDNKVGPLKLPVGNKYITVEAALSLKAKSMTGAPVLGENAEYVSGFGKLILKFRALLGRRYQKQAASSPTVPADIPNQSQPPAAGKTGSAGVPVVTSAPTSSAPKGEQDMKKVPVVFSYTLSGKQAPEKLEIWMTPDGVMRNYEVRLPDIGGIEISKMQLLVEKVVGDTYTFGLRTVFVSADSETDTSQTENLYPWQAARLAYPSPAAFQFRYTGNTPVTHYIDISDKSDMSSGVYIDFGHGVFGRGDIHTVTVSDPTKWDAYTCGKTLYWRVRQGDFYKPSGLSPIQGTNISPCVQPTVAPPVSGPTADLTLIPPAGSPTSNAGGSVHIAVTSVSAHYSNDPNYKIMGFAFSGDLKNLKPNKQYKVLLCMRNLNECVSSGSMNLVNTDGSGNGSFTISGYASTVRKDNPVSFVQVQDFNECSAFTAPCLRAEYNLGSYGF